MERGTRNPPKEADSATDHVKTTELKRRRRELLAVAIASLTLIAFVLAQTTLPPLRSHNSLVSNLVVILLFDLSFILLGLMLILVGRNLAKAIFERRRGLLGSRLQARLVFGFSAVALVPSVFLLYVSGTFLEADVGSWFNPEYERVLDDSLQIAKTYYLNSANNAVHFARVLAGQIADKHLLAADQHDALRRFIERSQHEYNLGTVEIFSTDRKLVMHVLSPRMPTGIGVGPDSEIVTATLAGRPQPRTDRFGKSDVIRGAAPIYASADSDVVTGALVIDYYLPRSLADRAAGISRSEQEYFQLRILRQPIMHSYILALVLIGLAVVLLASWFGIYIARGITGPIRLLAEGTQAIAAGNLNLVIPGVGDDEIGRLVESFNGMTADLRASRAEIERRRHYTETLLRNVSAGVVGLDAARRLTAINPCAERMLGLTATAVGQAYDHCFHPALVQALEDYFGASMPRRETRFPLELDSGGAETDLMVTVTPLGIETNGDGAPHDLGAVLFFEDVSQLAKVERMEAWREVARRIAHEIKNPLTPIQLSAERLRRNLATTSDADARLLDECTNAIVGEVQDLKRLVNEFSGFARMPQVTPVPGDLNALAEETVSFFREAHPAVDFAIELERGLPPIALDREALKRALVNLLDNGVAAASAQKNGERPRIRVTTRLEIASGIVALEVADNGVGIEPRLRARIFEPYFSTKSGGTGLGLAIVAAIVSDHHGFVRVYDRPPHGSRFVLEFPIKDQPTTNVTT
ncbi:MAG TPA: ATP-binding protein [Candidatus Binataceae bacterium]|nr:ATP-binding protein [Candidatus Binataceae bacterium]